LKLPRDVLWRKNVHLAFIDHFIKKKHGPTIEKLGSLPLEMYFYND
jgi:hypothetical protein